MSLLLFSFFLVLFEPFKLPLPRPQTTFGLAKIILLLLFLKQLFRLFKQPQLFNKKVQKIFLPLLVFTTLSLFSFLKAYHTSLAFNQLNFLLTGAIFFFLAFFQFDQKRTKTFASYLLFFTLGVGLLGILSFFFLKGTQNLWRFFFPAETLKRYLADLDRNRLLPYWDLEVATPLLLFFLLFGKNRKQLLGFLGLVLSLMVIFFSNTRYRLLTFLFGFLYLFLVKTPLSGVKTTLSVVKKRKKYLTLLPLLLFIPLALLLSKSQLEINLLDRFLFKNPGLDLYSLRIRGIYLDESLKIFKKFPLLGVGPANFAFFVTPDWRFLPYGNFNLNLLGEHNVISPHNIFLQLLTENGLLGFLSFLWLLLSFLKADLRFFKNRKEPLLLALSLSSWSYVFNNLFSIVNTSAAGMAYFLFLRGILVKKYQGLK